MHRAHEAGQALACLVAFQSAKPLCRIPLERGCAEFERGPGRFLSFVLFTTPAARARRDFPPDRCGHLSERGRSRAALEAFEPAVELGGGEMKSARQARRLEARRDLLHLADPAPGLARLD